MPGAKQCLETSFQFIDDLWGQQELSSYQSIQTQEAVSQKKRGRAVFFRIMEFFILGSMLGLFIGLASYFLDDFLFNHVIWQFSSFQPFLSWLPLFGFGFPTVLFLRQLQEDLLEKTKLKNPFLVCILSIFSAILMILGTLNGRALGNFLSEMAHGAILPFPVEFLNTIGAVIFRGGFLEIYRIIQAPDISHISRTVFLTVLFIYIVFSLQICSLSFIAWQKRLSNIQSQIVNETRSNHAMGWISLAVCITSLIIFTQIFPQKAIVDFLQARDHFQVGLEFQYQEKHKQAISEFQEATRLDPNLVEAYEELGWSNDELGNTHVAIDQLLKGIAINPNRATTHFYLGRVYYHDEQDEKAAQEFEQTVQIDPVDTQAYLGLGWSSYYLGKLDKAESSFKKALELEPDLYDAFIGLGTVFHKKGDLDQQIQYYLKATQSDNASSESFSFLGIAYFEKYEYELAIDNLKKATQYEDAHPISWIYLGLSYLYVGKIDQAIETAQKTAALDKNWAAPHALLAAAYTEMNQKGSAGDEIKKARSAKDKSDFDRFLILGALYDAERYQDAEEEARAGIQSSFNRSSFYLELARSLSGQERYAEAHQACNQAEALGANSADVLLQRGEIFLNEKKYNDGLAILLKAKKQDTNNPDVHNLLSAIYYQLGDYPPSITEAQEAVKINRYSLSGYVNLAYSSLALKKYKDVIGAATRASELSPHYDIPYYLQGAGYLGNYDDRLAYESFKKFIALYRGDPATQELRDEVEKLIDELEKSFKKTG